MKKTVYILLLLAFCFSLAGCGEKIPAEESPLISYQKERQKEDIAEETEEQPTQTEAAKQTPTEPEKGASLPLKETTPELKLEKEAIQQEEEPVSEAPSVREEAEQKETAASCTVSISCASVLDCMEKCDPAKQALIPADGWILKPEDTTFTEGESALDVLVRVCREKEIPLEYSIAVIYGSAYVEGIGNLYELDVGARSGWMYAVNGVFPSCGISLYTVQNGDSIELLYTCTLGEDIGGVPYM